MRSGSKTKWRHGAAVAGLALAGLALGGPGLEGQTRGTQERQQRVTPGQTDRDPGRPGELLLDRFAQRVGQALHLSADQTRRLRSELQQSRIERERIGAEARVIRQELARLIRESSTDQSRIGELLDQAMALEVRAAEVAVDEQRRLSEFLTPVQRARILWLRQRMAQQARDRVP